MMTKTIPLILTLGAICGACAAEAPPKPNPGDVERLLARMDAQRDDASDHLPDKAVAKVRRAERLDAPLEKVQADRIDPDLALELIV